MTPALLLALAETVSAVTASPAHAAEDCDSLLPRASTAPAGTAVSADDLARLRDVGPVYPYQPGRPILALSPDKGSVAFEIHRGDPANDSYCVGIAVLPFAPGARPHLVDVGRELILDPHPGKGWAAFESGAPLAVTPRWAPDGSWIAYLKRKDGRTQVWRTDLASGIAQQVSQASVDVDDFRITEDGQSLVYAARPSLIAAREAIDRESRSGWRFDSRSLPVRGPRPQAADVATHYRVIDLARREDRPASSEEERLFAMPEGVPRTAKAYARGPSGRLAWIETVGPDIYPPLLALVATSPSGARRTCPTDVCQVSAASRLWWSEDGRTLRYSRREGWANNETAIYEWRPGARGVRRLHATRDSLIECHTRGSGLVCLRERATEPRHLVLLGLGAAPDRTLFQTNPEILARRLGRAERLQWRNAFGVPFFGDLVYPVGFAPGSRHPMVVVQYRARGFLRGGVGDEMPIQAFAGRGYFVLVLDIGDEAAIVGPRSNYLAQQSASYRDLLVVKHALSAAETIIQRLVDRGWVDPAKVGISGLSAGARTVQFAALNSTAFSAGSAVGCCEEPGQDALLGPSIAANYHDHGFPRLTKSAPEFWRQLSIMTQPERVKFPLLVQAADSEYLVSLGAITALQQAGLPADLFVFPDEYHVKWHPAHRLAAYERNLAWFDFWLMDRMPEDPAAAGEAMRWRTMREAWLGRNPARR